MTLVNRSISNCSDSSSSQSYSVSTLGSASTYYMKKNNKKNSLMVSHSGRDNSSLKKSLQTVKKRMRKCKSSHDRMSWSLHTSDSDLRNAQFRTNRMGLDRQLSISRWMADNEHTGKIRRAVSSHGALSTHERPQVFIESLQQQQTNYLATPSSIKNAPFRLFQRAASQRTLSKPVRKRSSGPEGILQDMLMALSGHGKNTKQDPWKVSISTTSNSSNNTEDIVNLNDDIEVEDSVIDDSVVEFHEDTADNDQDQDDSNSTTPLIEDTQELEPLEVLLQKPSRWDALSPSRDNQEKRMLSPDKLLSRASSSKQMPIIPPPPPPFSPSTSLEGGKIPSKPLRATSKNLFKCLDTRCCSDNTNNDPLEAASAALAIATDMDEESYSDEEVELNDVVDAAQKYCSNGIDAATANSNNSSSHWGDSYSEDISVDGVSMLSVSVSNTTLTTMAGTNHSMLPANSSSATGSLAAYMKWAKNNAHQGQNRTRDPSCNSFAEDTFAQDTFATESLDPGSPRQFSKIALRACSDHHPVMALSKREASIVPPCMPKRSVSNHEKLDVAPRTPKSKRRSQSPMSTTNEAFRTVSSPTGDRLQRLLDAANKPKLTASRLGLAATPKQRFRRRVTMDHTPSTPTTSLEPPSFVRRRASLDHSLLEPSRQRKQQQQQQMQQRQCQTPKQRQTSLTSTITKTPRTSPSLSKSRKRLNSYDDVVGVDLQ